MITEQSFDQSVSRWQRLRQSAALRMPFFDPRWHALWQKNLGTGWTPWFLAIDDNCIAPFVRNDHELIFSGGKEISDYMDLIGPVDAVGHAWDQLLPYLKKAGIRTIRFDNIPEHSPTIDFFRKQPAADVFWEDTTPRLILPRTWPDYLNLLDRKNRHELERKIRKFEREHPGVTISQSAQPSVDIRQFLVLMQSDDKKAAFLTPAMTAFFEQMVIAFADQIRLSFVEYDGENIAGVLGFRVETSFLLYNSGLNPQYPGAGFYLKSMHIKQAIEQNISEYNFLQGNERYKYELGGKDFGVYSIRLAL